MGRKSRLKKLQREGKVPGSVNIPQSNNSIKVLTYLCLLATIITIFYLSFTVLKPGIPSGHDIAAHYSRTRMLFEALTQGQFPVRWVEWAYNGASEPLFNFYQPGFYYLVVALKTIIPSLILSLKINVLLMWWLGSLFMFLLLRRFGTLPALFSSIIYTFTPYIISDVFVRAAYPEFMAITFSLGLLWSLDRIILTNKWRYVFSGAVCLGLLISSHLPTLLILSPIIGLYLLIISLEQLNLKGFKLVILTVLFGFGIGSFYLLPAITEMNEIKPEILTSDTYDFHHHFVYFNQLIYSPWGWGISVDGPNDGMSFQFGAIQWVVLILSLLVLIFFKLSKKHLPHSSLILFWLLLIPSAIFLMTQSSIFFWENFKFISFIQYPWRLLMVVTISCSFLSALLLNLIKNKIIQCCFILAIIPTVLLLYGSFLKPSQILPVNFFNIDSPDWKASEGVQKYTFLEKGYLPKAVQELPVSHDIPRWQIASGAARIKERYFNYADMSFATQSSEPFTFRLNTHNFPGWKAFIDNTPVQIDSNNPLDYMHVIVPGGIHELSFKFTNTPVRTLANTISLISLIVLIALTGRKIFS